MGKLLGVAVIIIMVVSGLAIYSYLPKGPDQTIGTHPIKFSAIDRLAGSQDATTSAVDIYRTVAGVLTLQESVLINAAEVSSVMSYTSMEVLSLRMFDATDTSICTQYVTMTVPFDNPSNVYNNYYMIDLLFTDRGDTAVTVKAEYDTTDIPADTLLDVSTRGWTTAFATWRLTLRETVDDKGYVNSYDFLNKHLNDHYLVLDVYDVSGSTSGGWTNFIISGGGGFEAFERNNHRYFAIHLTDDAVTRDKQSNGVYNPQGTYDLDLTMNFKGFGAGQNVTIVQSYRYYADWNYFKDTGSWGENTASATLTFYMQY